MTKCRCCNSEMTYKYTEPLDSFGVYTERRIVVERYHCPVCFCIQDKLVETEENNEKEVLTWGKFISDMEQSTLQNQ